MSNILDKTDRSQQLGPGRTVKSKRIANKWTTPGRTGVVQMIPKQDLNIDGKYQKEKLSKNTMEKIAREWDWSKFGVILVVRRPDGSLWVYDGGHRVRAAFFREDINELPCLVFDSDDIASEAAAFIGVNKVRTNICPIDTHRALLDAGDLVASAVEQITQDNGYTIGRHEGYFKIRFITELYKAVRINRQCAASAFKICAEMASGEKIPSNTFKGLHYLARVLPSEHNVFQKKYLQRLTKVGVEGCEMAITNYSKALSVCASKRVCGEALLNIINKGLHNRLSLPSDR